MKIASLLLVLVLVGCHPSKTYPDKSITFLNLRGVRWGLDVGNYDEALDAVGLYGMTDCPNHRIIIAGGLNHANQRETIFHELLHAGTCDDHGALHNQFYNSETPEGHEGIYKIAEYVSSVLNENPELALYLAGKQE